jgi:hypothetical protein
MSRSAALLAFLLPLLLLTSTASALELRWATGPNARTTIEATRCTVIVDASPAEELPEEWRLLWRCAGCEVLPLAEPGGACGDEVARARMVRSPSSAFERAAGTATAEFCAEGGARAARASYVFDLPAGASGRLAVVALDADGRVQRSNEIVFNGGTPALLPPAILRVVTSHSDANLTALVTGAGLDAVERVTLVTRDSARVMPMVVGPRTDTTLAVAGWLPEALEDASMVLETDGAGVGADPVPDDPLSFNPAAHNYISNFSDPNPSMRPKDFAFAYTTAPDGSGGWRGRFHLFYIRARAGSGDDDARVLAHAWYRGAFWSVDTLAFPVGSGWDGERVWAPSIVQFNGLYHMFYTGVDAAGNQRIGFATTSLLDTTNTVWTRSSSHTFSASDADWVSPVTPEQFRDPYVMVDPENSNRLLLFYAARNRFDEPRNAVGFARSEIGDASAWSDRGYLRSTDSQHSGGAARVESPHLFPDSAHAAGASGDPLWRLFFTDGPAAGTESIQFETMAAGGSLSDTSLANWSHPAVPLFTYLGEDQTVNGWAGTEHLRAGKVSFIAGYAGSQIVIRRLYWNSTDFTVGLSHHASVPETGTLGPGPHLRLDRPRPGVRELGFRIALATAGAARLTIHDVMGREVARLLDEHVPAGERRVGWDGRGSTSSAAPSGVYFARLTTPHEGRAIRFALVR